ncbi:hypothetical protein [Paenibacillus sp. N3.4]|uniref:hypothetical protein n=1 Tax=Paenibacillus sp. N3.4 TaxID=2603222 RepID=UPI0011CCB211|nr:hypothetical protein [Paenibacillus sp. N3.4]TXK75903.1 hypothetical protein FU659_27000 [Paenibacillus sp. N3.4]
MRNKISKLAGMCVLIPALLSGCGNQPTAQNAAAAAGSTTQPQQQSGQASTDKKQSGQNRPTMNEGQRQLFNTFQTLLRLDKTDGLTITKDQAQSMLPVAQDIISKAELSDDNKTKLLEKLTDAQKKFMEDQGNRMNNRGNGGGNAGGNGNQNAQSGDTGKTPDASSNPSSAGGGTANGADQGPSGGKRFGNGNGGQNNNGNRPTGEMKDPGTQLVELLQSKLK